MSKGHQGQLEGIPTGQIWSKLSIKMNNNGANYNVVNKSESILQLLEKKKEEQEREFSSLQKNAN